MAEPNAAFAKSKFEVSRMFLADYEKTKFTVASRQPGDHIVVKIVFGGEEIPLLHHGIYLGKGGENEVAHYVHEEPRGYIQATSLEKFAHDRVNEIFELSYNFGSSLPLLEPREVVERAEKLASKKFLSETSYDLLSVNCEHFAYWCRTGEWMSRQANIMDRFLYEELFSEREKLLAGIPKSGVRLSSVRAIVNNVADYLQSHKSIANRKMAISLSIGAAVMVVAKIIGAEMQEDQVETEANIALLEDDVKAIADKLSA